MELLAERGYDAVTVRDLAGAAAISTPVLYDHFPGGKRELQAELVRQQAAALTSHAVREFEAETPEEFLRKTLDAFFAFIEANPYAWRMLFRDLPADPELAQVHHAAQRRATQAIARLFALSRWHLSVAVSERRGQELLAEMTKSALNGLAAWWWDHSGFPREHLVGIAMDLLWTGAERLLVVDALPEQTDDATAGRRKR